MWPAAGTTRVSRLPLGNNFRSWLSWRSWGHGVRSCLLPPPFSARSWGQVLPFGLVLGIANLITFHGDSVALFEAALHAAVAGYVDACRRLGDAPEKLAMAA